jgi:hypothetical protein
LADFVASFLDIGLALSSTLLFLTGTMNLVGFLLQVRSGEEDLKIKTPTFLNLIGIALLGLAGSLALVLTGSDQAKQAILLLSTIFLLFGTYLGLKKHAQRYIGPGGDALKVTLAGTHELRSKLRQKGIRIK